MRTDAKQENNATLKRLSGYHGGEFESIKFFNSDRPILLDENFKVSANNTASTLSIKKVGSEIGGFGIEWEMVAPNLTVTDYSKSTILCNLVDMVFDTVFPKDLFKTESDCTVDIECVSQIMSKAFIRNNYRNFKACYDRLLSGFGITTDSVKCGMHVNISASLFGKTATERTENARKLGYLINKHYNFFKVAFNRNASATSWCPQMTTSKANWQNNSISSFPTSHSACCFNWRHWDNGNGRIEVRLVGGQKNYACFRNTMETVFHLMDMINKLSWDDLDDLTKVFKGCNSYVYDRLTKCRNEYAMSDEQLAKIRPTVKTVEYI